MNDHRGALGRFVNRPIEDRFWEKVNKHGPILREGLGECWVWEANRTSNGYGTLRESHGKRRTLLAHRIAWEIIIGPIPDGMCVLHKCDNPSCVRADKDPTKSHLFLGAQAENIKDMYAKGRQALKEKTTHYGENNGSAILTAGEVLVIREKFTPHRYGYKKLGEEYGVSQHTISAIVRGVIWRYEEAGYGILASK